MTDTPTQKADNVAVVVGVSTLSLEYILLYTHTMSQHYL